MKSAELFSALIQLSRADNYFDQFEFSYLLKVGRHIGLEDKLVESMIKENTALPLSIPKDEKDRMTILYYMLFLMKIDNIISEEEVELVHHYGFKLGFSSQMLSDFIQVMEKNKFKEVDQKELLEIIRKYQN